MKVAITATRTFTSDAAGLPLSRQLALAEQEPQPKRREELSEEAQRAYLLATGIEPIEHKRPEHVADAWLIATGVQPAIGGDAAEPVEQAASGDPLGDRWVAQTTEGFAS